MTLLRLNLLNVLRWFRANAFAWIALGVPYFFGIGLLLEPFLEEVGRGETKVTQNGVWAVLLGVFIGAIVIRLLAQNWNRGFPLSAGFAPGKLYVQNRLRELWTFFTALIIVLLADLALSYSILFWIFLIQLGVQRELYSVSDWRNVFLLSYPQSGAARFLSQFRMQQLIFFFLVWGAMGVSGLLGGFQSELGVSSSEWLQAGWVGLGAVLGASAVALEGDSGRPILVQLISLTTGTLAGLVCFASPWILPIVIYFVVQIEKMSINRLKSVENFYEDTLIS
jgi:hypothetical protein